MTANAKPGGNFQLKPQQKIGTNPKLRGLGCIAKIPEGTWGQGLHPGKMEPKYLEARWGPPTLSGLEPKERGQENSTRPEVAPAAAPQVCGGEQLLLIGELPPHTRLWVLETSQSRETAVLELPGVPDVGREGRSRLGERKSFGVGGMCYCEEGICLPRRKEEGGRPRSRRQVHG